MCRGATEEKVKKKAVERARSWRCESLLLWRRRMYIYSFGGSFGGERRQVVTSGLRLFAFACSACASPVIFPACRNACRLRCCFGRSFAWRTCQREQLFWLVTEESLLPCVLVGSGTGGSLAAGGGARPSVLEPLGVPAASQSASRGHGKGQTTVSTPCVAVRLSKYHVLKIQNSTEKGQINTYVTYAIGIRKERESGRDGEGLVLIDFRRGSTAWSHVEATRLLAAPVPPQLRPGWRPRGEVASVLRAVGTGSGIVLRRTRR